MKTVIIVSKCLKVVKMNLHQNWFHFHFKGVYSGEVLRKVTLRGRSDFGLIKGEEYLIYARLISCEEGLLTGEILKIKPLSECWDKS